MAEDFFRRFGNELVPHKGAPQESGERRENDDIIGPSVGMVATPIQAPVRAPLVVAPAEPSSRSTQIAVIAAAVAATAAAVAVLAAALAVHFAR